MRDGMLKCGKTESEVTTGGVSGDAQPFHVEPGERIIFVCEQSTVGAADVLKCSGPSAAGIAHATIFDVPGCNANFFEGVAKMSGVSQVILGAPVAAVNEEDYRMRAFSSGNANVNKLIWVLSVREAQIGVRWFLLQNSFALHAKQYRTVAQSRKRSRALSRNLAAKHSVDEYKVADGQQHAKAPPD